MLFIQAGQHSSLILLKVLAVMLELQLRVQREIVGERHIVHTEKKIWKFQLCSTKSKMLQLKQKVSRVDAWADFCKTKTFLQEKHIYINNIHLTADVLLSAMMFNILTLLVCFRT